MGKIVAAEYVTVDGVMQDPGGVGEIELGGWTHPYFNDELGKFQSELLFASDALLLGRVTFQGFAAAWPDMEESAGEFAVKMNTMPKHVATRTLKELEWNATLIEGEVPDEVARLKQSDQNFLIYGSGTLVNTLMQHDLIDQYRLMIFPVVLGQGKRLFGEGSDKKHLRPVATNTTGTGVIVVDYEPA